MSPTRSHVFIVSNSLRLRSNSETSVPVSPLVRVRKNTVWVDFSFYNFQFFVIGNVRNLSEWAYRSINSFVRWTQRGFVVRFSLEGEGRHEIPSNHSLQFPWSLALSNLREIILTEESGCSSSHFRWKSVINMGYPVAFIARKRHSHASSSRMWLTFGSRHSRLSKSGRSHFDIEKCACFYDFDPEAQRSRRILISFSSLINKHVPAEKCWGCPPDPDKKSTLT